MSFSALVFTIVIMNDIYDIFEKDDAIINISAIFPECGRSWQEKLYYCDMLCTTLVVGLIVTDSTNTLYLLGYRDDISDTNCELMNFPKEHLKFICSFCHEHQDTTFNAVPADAEEVCVWVMIKPNSFIPLPGKLESTIKISLSTEPIMGNDASLLVTYIDCNLEYHINCIYLTNMYNTKFDTYPTHFTFETKILHYTPFLKCVKKNKQKKKERVSLNVVNGRVDSMTASGVLHKIFRDTSKEITKNESTHFLYIYINNMFTSISLDVLPEDNTHILPDKLTPNSNRLFNNDIYNCKCVTNLDTINIFNKIMVSHKYGYCHVGDDMCVLSNMYYNNSNVRSITQFIFPCI